MMMRRRQLHLTRLDAVHALAMLLSLTVGTTLADGESGKRAALLVGISYYHPDRFAELPGAEPDARGLARILKRNGYANDDVVLMSNRVGAENPKYLPTASRIRKQLRHFVKQHRDVDSLIVAFAGHGVQDAKGEYCVCPQDANLSKPDSLISVREIYDVMDESNAGFKLLLIDACRQDTAVPVVSSKIQSVTRAGGKANAQNLPEPPPRTAAFFSCSSGQLAYERHDKGETNGVFFHAIIRGLDGAAVGTNGSVTLPDLERFVKKDVENYVRNTYSAAQHPVIRNNTVGLVPLVTYSRTERELKRAFGLWVRSRHDESLRIVDELLATRPKDAKAVAAKAYMLCDRAEEARDTAMMDKAFELAQQAIRLAPSQAEGYVARASFYRVQKNHTLSLNDCNKAIQCDADCAFAYLQRSAIRMVQRDTDGMLKDIRQAIALDESEPTARALHSAYLFSLGKIEEGFAEIKRGLVATPDVPLLHFMKGYGLDQQKNYDKAILAYTAAIRLDALDDDLYCRRAISLANAGDFPAAIEDVESAEKIDPENPDIYPPRVLVLFKQGKFNAAIQVLDKAIRQHPDQAEFYQQRSMLHKRLGNWIAAQSDQASFASKSQSN